MKVKAPAAAERDDAERLVRLLRQERTDPAEVRAALQQVLIDANVLVWHAYGCLGDEDAQRFLGRLLHKRSEAAQVAAADRKAWEVRRVIDDLLRSESGLKNSMLADRLNELGITAPRGGKWSEAQVYRVLRRTGGTQRPQRKNRSGAR